VWRSIIGRRCGFLFAAFFHECPHLFNDVDKSA
jgi:hypothetical protein